ncbi:MAG: hypothetical protein ACOCYC_03865 [bacterium]
MRYFAVFLLFLGLVFSLGAQDVDISEIEPRDLDPQLLDISEASFYFQGPLEIYVQDLVYDGHKYAAVLDYDGDREVRVEAPEDYGADMRPSAIDMSGVEIELKDDGSVTLTGAVINGFEYEADLVYQDGRTLAATEGFDRLGPATSPQGVAAERIDKLQQELAQAQVDQDRAETQIEQLRAGNRPVAVLQDEVERLESRIEERDARIARLNNRVSELRVQLDDARNPTMPQLPRLVHSGFEGQSTSFGRWQSPERSMEQTDSEARFAKVIYPVEQDGSAFTYAVEASAPDSGWVGYGVHFLADGFNSARGYGLGRSYLLWVTRDPEHNQTDRGFVQLYQSFNDVHMIEVASAILPVSSFNELRATVHADTVSNEIEVYLDGQYAFTFPAADLADGAEAVALRALGPVTFTELSVRSRP